MKGGQRERETGNGCVLNCYTISEKIERKETERACERKFVCITKERDRLS